MMVVQLNAFPLQSNLKIWTELLEEWSIVSALVLVEVINRDMKHGVPIRTSVILVWPLMCKYEPWVTTPSYAPCP